MAVSSTACLGSATEMNLTKMLDELRQEQNQIAEAILNLERLALGRGKRRGRPPAWLVQVKKRGRPPGSKNKAKAETYPIQVSGTNPGIRGDVRS
jgi:hypothetical protein